MKKLNKFTKYLCLGLTVIFMIGIGVKSVLAFDDSEGVYLKFDKIYTFDTKTMRRKVISGTDVLAFCLDSSKNVGATSVLRTLNTDTSIFSIRVRNEIEKLITLSYEIGLGNGHSHDILINDSVLSVDDDDLYILTQVAVWSKAHGINVDNGLWTDGDYWNWINEDDTRIVLYNYLTDSSNYSNLSNDYELRIYSPTGDVIQNVAVLIPVDDFYEEIDDINACTIVIDEAGNIVCSKDVDEDNKCIIEADQDGNFVCKNEEEYTCSLDENENGDYICSSKLDEDTNESIVMPDEDTDQCITIDKEEYNEVLTNVPNTGISTLSLYGIGILMLLSGVGTVMFAKKNKVD